MLHPKLYSETTGKPFDQCSICHKSLENQMHFIEKAYHRNLSDNQHAVIFEYAICESCKREMLQHVSQESFARMQAFMAEHEDDLSEFMEKNNDFSSCSFTKKPIDEMEEYHLVAVIKNGKLQMPNMIFGTEIMESYQEILSEETKGFFDDFHETYIDIPPELAKLLGKNIKPVLM